MAALKRRHVSTTCATLAAGFLMRVDNQNSDRVSSGYTASGQYGAVPGPTAGAGLPIALLVSAPTGLCDAVGANPTGLQCGDH